MAGVLGLMGHQVPAPPELFSARERLDMEKLLDITNTEEAFDWHEWDEEETEVVMEIEPTEDLQFSARSSALTSNVEKMIRNVEDLDIMKLDVKVSKNKTHKVEDVDFFADMKPEIPKAATALEEFEKKLKISSSPKKSSLQVPNTAYILI